MSLVVTQGFVRAMMVIASASLALGCGSYVPHDDSGPPPLPSGSKANDAIAAQGGGGATSMPSAMIATGSAGMHQDSAGMSGGSDDANDEGGRGGSSVSAAISGSGGGGEGGRAGAAGSSRNAGSGGASGAGDRAGAGGQGGAAGQDDGDGTTRDVTGPCRDLDLFCLNDLDMFLLNPECFTCNDGMGCQTCEFFRAI